METKKLNPWEALPDKTMLTLYTDGSTPLILDLQTFWFENIITKFLDSLGYFESSRGLMVSVFDGFTYEPIKMGKSTTPYLFGFYSNESGGCYTKASIMCSSETEKSALREIILGGMNELLQGALEKYPNDMIARIHSEGKVPGPLRSLRITIGTELGHNS